MFCCIIIDGCVNTLKKPEVYLIGELYAVETDIMPSSSRSEPAAKRQRQETLSFLKDGTRPAE